MSVTDNLELTKPAEGSTDWAGSMNDNLDTLDEEVNGKADKVDGAVADNFASLDANGNLQDSGKADSDYEDAGAVTTHEASHDHSNIHSQGTDQYLDQGGDNEVAVADVKSAVNDSHSRDHGIDDTSDHNGVSGATEDNLLAFDDNGLPKDSGVAKELLFGVNLIAGDGANAISTGALEHIVEIPCDCTIKAVRLFADQDATLTIDIWKDSYANFPPEDADSICGGSEIGTSASRKAEDTTLSGWTTSVSAGDILMFNVDANDSATQFTLGITFERAG